MTWAPWVDASRPDWYAEYRRSVHWLAFREVAYRAACYRCVKCGWAQQPGEKWRLEVHHLSYANLGREQPEDVTVLCDRCHDVTHEKPAVERRSRTRRQGDTAPAAA